jgi:hypothetical protein
MVAPLVGIAIGAAARAVAKKAAANAVKKTVTKKAAKAAKGLKKSDEKITTEVIQGNSVRVVKPTKAAVRLEKNSMAKAKADTAKTGAMARYYAGQIEKNRQLPSKVVKINSAPAKSADAAKKAANAKALKAANKKKK